MSENANHILEKINSKVERLMLLNEEYEKHIKAMSEENNILKRTIQSYEWKIKELDEKNKLLALAGTIKKDDNENAAIKLQINEMVKEIDKCIKLISQ